MTLPSDWPDVYAIDVRGPSYNQPYWQPGSSSGPYYQVLVRDKEGGWQDVTPPFDWPDSDSNLTPEEHVRALVKGLKAIGKQAWASKTVYPTYPASTTTEIS